VVVSLALDLAYLVVAVIALPWVLWRRLAGGRPIAAPLARFMGRVEIAPRPAASRRVWLHGVSVGEVQLLATVAAELKRQAEEAGRQIDCVISSSTTTGLALADRRFGRDRTFPCPLDFSWAVRRVLRRVEPDLLVLGELELWPNLLAAAASRGVPVAIVNGRMSPRSFRGFSRVRPLAAAMLSRVRLVLARSQEDAQRFTALGAPTVQAVGSLKFDGVSGDRQAEPVCRLRQLAGLGPPTPVLLAGSTQEPEEALAVATLVALRPRHPALRLVLVPRHAERAGTLASWLNERLRQPDAEGLRWDRRSQRAEEAQPEPPADILLVDVTGELAAWWGVATVAFVGGSLDGVRGGQNMLEPAAYAAAVCFGPHTRNFRSEVTELLAANAAQVVSDGESLTAFVGHCLDDPSFAAGMGERARRVIDANRGATATTVSHLLRLLPGDSPLPVAGGGQNPDTGAS
jgi:3-deoxy-D-manno-octulosonic-acid transferase